MFNKSFILNFFFSLMDPPGVRHQCLMLADSESEKTKWVVALNELHRILKKNKLPGEFSFWIRYQSNNSNFSITIT